MPNEGMVYSLNRPIKHKRCWVTQSIISVDGMGGDFGPKVTIPALAEAHIKHPQVRFLLFGDEAKLHKYLAQYPALQDVVEVRHCEITVAMDEKLSVALRQKRKESSMWCAIEAVKNGQAQACLSAGNTGALMAMSKIILRTHIGIERPAIAAIWPTLRGRSVMLDAGANIGGTAAQYVQFAVMGATYARIILNVPNPRVGLLNIGVENIKGTEDLREAADLLARSSLNFVGFIEGNGIGRGDADVIVTDGFTGNVALKTAEGTAVQISNYLREAMSSSLISRLGYLFASRALATLKQRMDPNSANGGMFLGLNGSVVKSHGGANRASFEAAIEVAIEVAQANMADTIADDMMTMQQLLDSTVTTTSIEALGME